MKKQNEELMKKLKKNPKYISGENQFLANDFLINLTHKINKGLLMTYKLQGSPTKLLSYLKSIFHTVTKAEIDQKLDKQLKNRFGITLKTARLYEKEIKQGKINIHRDVGDKFKFYHLTEDEVFIIIQEKKERQKHKKTGFISQRGLLDILQNEKFLNGLKKEGHPLKKYGKTTLKKALMYLKQNNRIDYNQKKRAVFYKETDVPGIADELTEYFNTKRKK